MNKEQAIAEIRDVFRSYKNLTKNDFLLMKSLQDGKLYELFCLSHVLKKLRHEYGYVIRFHGVNIQFQSSPGKIDRAKSYFELFDIQGQPRFELFLDIEFEALGCFLRINPDKSAYHEIDIVLVENNIKNKTRPWYKKIVLGVECKAHSKVRKSTIKEVLGIRRELGCWLNKEMKRSTLSEASPYNFQKDVPCVPPSEYWLMHLCKQIEEYKDSPNAFGIDVINLNPS